MSENREQVFENEEFHVLLRKYEDMRGGTQSIFFDVEEFEQIIDYYLDMVPGAIYSNARRRLFLISPEDGSSRPLSKKLLEHQLLQ